MPSTKQIGDALEDRVFGLIPSWLDDGSLALPGHAYELRRRSCYPSAKRGGVIRFENCVEFHAEGPRTGANARPGLVAIFECKSLGRRVDVQEIEEFDAKLNGGLGFKAKGFVVTTTGFTKQAVNRARFDGIGLIRLMPEDQVEVLLYRMTPEQFRRIAEDLPKRAMRGLTQADHRAHFENCYCIYRDRVFPDVHAMMSTALTSD